MHCLRSFLKPKCCLDSLPEFLWVICDRLLAPDHGALTYLLLLDTSSASRLAMTFSWTAEILLVVWPWVVRRCVPVCQQALRYLTLMANFLTVILLESAGVQGWDWGPIPFALYLLLLGSVIESLGLNFHLLTADLQPEQRCYRSDVCFGKLL